MDLRARRVVVYGLGASGRAAARLCVERGADVVGVDRDPGVAPIPGATLALGPERAETFATADLVVVSPGIPPSAAPVRAAVAAGVEVIGEIALAHRCVGLPVAGITGTNGKSTTTHFAGQLCEAAGLKPFVGGNLGRAYAEAGFAENAGRYELAVLELSSYQLEWCDELAPRVGAVLNLTPDHLARHGDLLAYGRAKCRMFARCGPEDLAAVPADDAPLVALAAEQPGARVWIGAHPGVVRDGADVQIALPDGRRARFDLSGFQVPGEHNRDNVAVAAMFAVALGGDAALVQAEIPRLLALPHRMQVVAERAGVTWIDDSKATNVAATLTGLRGLPDRRGVLLLGGEAKTGDDFRALAPHLAPWRVLTFGGSGAEIARALEDVGIGVDRRGGLADAVGRAASLVDVGETVLLSPGCASFDEFRNFEHRGEVFAALAREASR